MWARLAQRYLSSTLNLGLINTPDLAASDSAGKVSLLLAAIAPHLTQCTDRLCYYGADVTTKQELK